MSESDVYEPEMTNKRFSDQDVELLLSGETPDDESLARLAPLMKRMQTHIEVAPPDERVTEFAAEAAEIAASSSPVEAGAVAPVRTMRSTRRNILTLKRKLATGLASVLLLSGMTGVAIAADDAAPGDTLYGLDQALASIGIGDGGAAEAAQEAADLANNGKLAEALAHAANAVAQAGDNANDEAETENDIEGAVDGLENAATSVLSEGDLESEGVRIEVAAMLQSIADMLNGDGEVDGAAVSDWAKNLADSVAGVASDEASDAADEADGAEENGDENVPTDIPPVSTPAGP